MTLKEGGSSQACTACKYHTRKCSQRCPLCPHFGGGGYQPKMFLNVHRLFGMCNILKILRKVQPAQKDEAVKSIIYQAYIRDRYPGHGCCGIISSLQCQIQQAEQELQAVYVQLSVCKQEEEEEEISCDDLTSELQLGKGPLPLPLSNSSTFHQVASHSFNTASALNNNIGYNS